MIHGLWESTPVLRGSVFTDRGVYRPGEDVHFKVIARSDTPTGMRLLSDGTAVEIDVTDNRDRTVDHRLVKVNHWSSADWTWIAPAAERGRRLPDRDSPAEHRAEAPGTTWRGPRLPRGLGCRRRSWIVPRRGLPPARFPRRRHDQHRRARGRPYPPCDARGAVPVWQRDGEAARCAGRSPTRPPTACPPRSADPASH